jgi:N-acetylglutamate synthase-like GNAT family acetyltransferase
MFTIKTPTTHDDFKAYYTLRYRVLSEPWGFAKGTEKDDYEPISEHFMAVNENDEVVGVVKLYKQDECLGHISHLVVAPEYQHQGIGHLLLETVEQYARSHGYCTLGTMARATATADFEKFGFHIAGISAPHLGTTHLVWMEKALDQPASAQLT